MKLACSYLSVILTCCFLISCSNDSSYVVGYMNPSADRARFVDEGNFMAERLKQLGIQTIVVASEDNDALQLQHGYELLDKGVDMLVIASVNGNTIAPLVREAHRRGVKVMAYNMLINNTDFDLFFTMDNEHIARLFCETAISRYPSGNYVVLGGDRFDRNGLEVKQYIDSILKPHIESGRINLLYSTYIERWNGEIARHEFQQVIDAYGTDIHAVLSCNDPMGLGVVEVLKKYGLEGEVVVTGQDALLDAVRSVHRGEMTMTIYHPHRAMGYKVAELASEMLQGKSPQEISNWETFNGLTNIPTFRMQSVAIARDNIEKEIVQVGQFTWDQIR